jgi:hypothetical protein
MLNHRAKHEPGNAGQFDKRKVVRTNRAARGAGGEGMSTPESLAAALLGRKGGLKGGPARAAKLTPERRSEIARIAAAKRWGKHVDIDIDEMLAQRVDYHQRKADIFRRALMAYRGEA